MKHRHVKLAISPYHLTTREVPAMAALLLGDHVVTLLPEPATGTSRDDVDRAVNASPRYIRLLDSWRWASPLFKSRVIESMVNGVTPFAEFEGVVHDIEAEESLTPLRPMAKLIRSLDPAAFLDLLSADILRGGPNPSMSIPVAAALDRFSLANDYISVRAGATSVAQRAESKLSRRLFNISAPFLLRAGGTRLSRARQALEDPLQELRIAVLRVFQAATSAQPDASEAASRAVQALRAVADQYAAAFRSLRVLTGDDEDEGVRVTWGWVSISGVLLPDDCVLRSSRAAMQTMQASAATPSTRGSDWAEHASREARETRWMPSLILREMDVRPDAD
jgi:hypothetical protein